MTSSISSKLAVPSSISPDSNALSEVPSWDLLRDCTAGECEASWNELVRRVSPRLERSVRRLLRRLGGEDDPSRVEDLLQEVFFRLVASWGRPARRFRGSSEAEATSYLHRVALHVVLDSRRDACAGKRGGGWRTLRLLAEEAEALPAPLSDSPESGLLRRDQRRIFRRRCRELLGPRTSARTVRIAELALLEGLTSGGIVARGGSGPGISGVNSIVHRLRRGLERRGCELPRRARRRAAAPGR